MLLCGQRGDVCVELTDIAAGLAQSCLQILPRSSERHIGSPGPHHCDDRSDEHHQQDPQQWILGQ
ncbi:hypothetical protein AV521_04450 [Streptomyces sp. IMTB 2501]|nr:hypothetical protein AV521_04450 [Streptomyces sp. IMTB 2501]